MSIQDLRTIRDRIMPMFEAATEQYMHRAPGGYPLIVDDADKGVIGLEIDPNFSLYITSDGNDLYAEFYRRQSRIDARSSSSRQKYAGLPFQDRRPLPADSDEQALRNLVAELKNHFNIQPGMMYITDD